VHPTAEAAREAVRQVLGRDPHTCGLARSRWRLADLLAQVPGWRVQTCQGLGQVVARLGLSYKRGRDAIHSPDPDYDAKLAAVQQARRVAHADPAQQVLLYLDEMTLYRQPTVARAWAARGRDQALARRSTRSDTRTRLLGALDATTGQVHSLRAETISVPTLVRFLRALVAAYPGKTLTVVLDNWSNHFHPDLLCALAPQQGPFPFLVPANWSPTPSAKAQRQWGTLQLPISLLPLPTYASWANPIEKLWRKLRQDLGHLHPWADDLPQLRTAVDAWLAAYDQPAPDLLRYVGLATHD
jgi:DDE superfamily endonuclease